jgi:DNA repair protein RecO (recombination protein O)
MEWQDQGSVLSARQHGETSAIVEIFTLGHGRHAGVVRGGISRKIAPHLQPGSVVAVTWRARLDAHIGSYSVEPVRNRSGALFGDRPALAALNSVTALLAFMLPEREPHPGLFARTEALLDRLGQPGWDRDYLRWELALLEEMGFGLDLSQCAVTGAREGLAYVSPKTGRAVSAAGAGAYADRLLPLPASLLGQADDAQGIAAGLQTTGYFLERHLAPVLGERPLPEARRRLVAALARGAKAGSDDPGD